VLSDHALSRALEGAGLSAPVRFEEVTRSTQATALRLAEDGAPEWTLVAAGHQTEGRGRLGRTWMDEPGKALLFSLVLRPALRPELGGLLSLLAGTAMAEASEEVANQRAACKWPNDVLVAGAKAGGILAESRLAGDGFEFVALGVGVNLGAAPAGVPGAGAVRAEDSDLLAAFLRAFAARYEPSHPGFARAVVAAYRTRCATLGTSVRARTEGGTVVEGEAVDVDETGALLVRVAGTIEAVRFGEVEHLE
jgi:BirA family transcriptional regulator, biotin operon repressor / biotin---[acetyl-CoA-carboxylase] ligase